MNNQLGVRGLNISAGFWFVTTAVGQWIFVIYIFGLYVLTGLQGGFEAWNKVLPHGYEESNGIGNAFLGTHLYFAMLISFLGPLQLIPKIRARCPKFHRWSGRVYMLLALAMATSGLYLILADRMLVGDISQHIAIAFNAAFILIFGALALWRAITRSFVAHRRWALRLFLAVSGVWLFRVGLMFWLVIHGGPVGFDNRSFSGPFLTILAFTVYVFPVVLLEVYLRAKDSSNPLFKIVTSAGLFALTIAMTIGIFGATAGIWLPRLG